MAGSRGLSLLTVTIISRYRYKSIGKTYNDSDIILLKLYIDIAIYSRYNKVIMEEALVFAAPPGRRQIYASIKGTARSHGPL